MADRRIASVTLGVVVDALRMVGAHEVVIAVQYTKRAIWGLPLHLPAGLAGGLSWNGEPLTADRLDRLAEIVELSGEEVQVACDADTDMATVVEVLLARHSELGASLVLTAADIDAPEPIPQMRGE